MNADYDVGDDFAAWCDDGYAELAEAHVYLVVGEGGKCVAQKWGEEDEGYYGVVDVVVYFELQGVQSELHGRNYCKEGTSMNEKVAKHKMGAGGNGRKKWFEWRK